MITPEIFEAAVGYKPEQDDLERCNCKQAGEIGHWCCGWNQEHNKPQYMLGPVYKPKSEPKPAKYWSLD